MRRRHLAATAVAGAVLATVVVAPAPAVAAVATTRDLTTPGTVRIAGSASNRVGNQVALLGDVNGDGIGDLATAGGSDFTLPPEGGSVVVVYGGRTGRLETDPLPAGAGFRITGVRFDFATRPFGPSVAAAGDVNGDGFADVLVGASGWLLPDGTATGRAFVIFGGVNLTDVDLGSLSTTRGFALVPPSNYRAFGYQVAGVDDVNRDGLADVAVAGSGTGEIFEVHVVYGRRSGGTVNLAAWTPALGWRLAGHNVAADGWQTFSLGNAVAGVGDVNGDGVPDIAVGGPSDAPLTQPNPLGAVYVIYGGRTSDLSTADLGCSACRGNGIRITGGLTDIGGWQVGSTVRGAGDVNGDGIADLLIGSNFGTSGAFVVLGRARNPAAISLARRFNGFTIRSLSSRFQPREACCFPGAQVAPAGDLNGDGRADVLVGNDQDSPTVDGVRHDLAGQVFVIYGRATTGGAIDVDNLSAQAGLRIVGGRFLDGFASGASIDGGRDITGDGRPDLAIGSQLLPGDSTADVSGVDILAGGWL